MIEIGKHYIFHNTSLLFKYRAVYNNQECVVNFIYDTLEAMYYRVIFEDGSHLIAEDAELDEIKEADGSPNVCRAYNPETGKCANGYTKCKHPHGDIFRAMAQTNYDCRRFGIIDPWVTCRKQSAFGNSTVVITEEDIQALRSGKILYLDDGEYTTMIIFDKVYEKMREEHSND